MGVRIPRGEPLPVLLTVGNDALNVGNRGSNPRLAANSAACSEWYRAGLQNRVFREFDSPRRLHGRISQQERPRPSKPRIGVRALVRSPIDPEVLLEWAPVS